MTEAQVYIVSIWISHTADSPFRASVRAVEDPKPRLFTAPYELARFIGEARQLGALPTVVAEADLPHPPRPQPARRRRTREHKS